MNPLGQFVFGLRPHPAAWLPVRPPGNPGEDWVRRWGDAEFRLLPHPSYGLPYGQDRLVLILLATAAVRQRSPHVTLPPAYQMLRLFALPPSGRNYSRWQERLRRVLGVRFSFVMGPLSITDRLCHDAEMWFENGEAEQNRVKLSGPFWDYLSSNYLPLELPVVQALSDSPSTLDFYVWLVARAYRVRPDRYVNVPYFGRGGLGELIGVNGWDDPRDFRKRVRSWVAQLRDCWVSMPAVIQDKQDALVVCHLQPPRNWGL